MRIFFELFGVSRRTFSRSALWLSDTCDPLKSLFIRPFMGPAVRQTNGCKSNLKWAVGH